MAAARPAIFIGAEDGEVARLIRREETGSVVPVGDGQALAETIMALARDGTKRRRLGANARNAFEARFTKAASIAAWDKLLRSMTGGEMVPAPGTEERLRDRGVNPSPDLSR
jgi:glycosyltransferase involved in cell wall biosynthesis